METQISPGWTKAQIKAALEDKGWSCRQLSFSRGYTSNAVQTALHKPYPAVERIISSVLGVDPDVIWPERYDENGNPNRRMGRRKLNGV